MLRDVVAGFLDTVSEREFDAPLMALLAAKGFTDIHFLHGPFEFGKDFIAKGAKAVDAVTGAGNQAEWTPHQFALQSKAGDLGLGEWRTVRGQLDEARLDGLAHPSFDTTLPRAAVLVVTGRLVGAATAQAQSYREAELRRGRPDFEVWDRERLLEWLVDDPDAGLAGSSDGPILALAGAIDAGQATYTALERYTRTWLPPVPGSLEAATTPQTDLAARQRRAMVQAAVLANRLRRRGRIDLAAMTALLLLRATWCHVLDQPLTASGRPEPAQAAVRLFAGLATELLEQVEPVAGDPVALLDALGATAFPHAAYPVACSRLTEILALLGLLAAPGAHEPSHAPVPAVSRIWGTVEALLDHQPGCTHPISDMFAVSTIAPALLAGRIDPEHARIFLRRTAQWLLDHYDEEQGAIGLAHPWAEAGTEVAYLLSAAPGLRPPRRTMSYLATVLIDLAAIIPQAGDVYLDLVNDVLAVGAEPQLLKADERRAQWRPDGAGVTLVSGITYAEPLTVDGVAARHFHDPAPPVPAWDALALTSVVRDRHVVAVLRANLDR